VDRREAPFRGRLAPLRLRRLKANSYSKQIPIARNYQKAKYSVSAEELLVDKAQLLTLTPPEMTVLVGGVRVLSANFGQTKHGAFTNRPESLTHDFFVSLLDMRTTWKVVSDDKGLFEGSHRNPGEPSWTGTRVDLIFGSNSELRALAEYYGSSDAQKRFVDDFVNAVRYYLGKPIREPSAQNNGSREGSTSLLAPEPNCWTKPRRGGTTPYTRLPCAAVTRIRLQGFLLPPLSTAR